MIFPTETLDKLFLELSQFTNAKTAKEIALEAENERLRAKLAQYQPYQPIPSLKELACNCTDRRKTASGQLGHGWLCPQHGLML